MMRQLSIVSSGSSPNPTCLVVHANCVCVTISIDSYWITPPPTTHWQQWDPTSQRDFQGAWMSLARVTAHGEGPIMSILPDSMTLFSAHPTESLNSTLQNRWNLPLSTLLLSALWHCLVPPTPTPPTRLWPLFLCWPPILQLTSKWWLWRSSALPLHCAAGQVSSVTFCLCLSYLSSILLFCFSAVWRSFVQFVSISCAHFSQRVFLWRAEIGPMGN